MALLTCVLDLRLSCNALAQLPAAVCAMNLTSLHADSNVLVELPRGIGRLTALKHLFVRERRRPRTFATDSCSSSTKTG